MLDIETLGYIKRFAAAYSKKDKNPINVMLCETILDLCGHTVRLMDTIDDMKTHIKQLDETRIRLRPYQPPGGIPPRIEGEDSEK